MKKIAKIIKLFVQKNIWTSKKNDGARAFYFVLIADRRSPVTLFTSA